MAKETLKKTTSKKNASHQKTSSAKSASGRSRGGSKKRASKKKKRMMIFGIEIAVILILVLGFWVVSKLDKIQKPKVEQDQIEVNESLQESTMETMKGYTTVALFGLDTREAGQLGSGNRSDTIIIASINNDTKEVKLVSVYRDTYLNLTNGKYNKCNSAYSSGGPAQAISMLNTNLDLDIEYYVSVDFAALTKTVDLLGGIDIDVDDAEIEHLNNYIVETSKVTGIQTQPLTSTGLQTLDGVQATSYCRIRYTAGDDFKRTERQREVIMQLVSKAKKMDISKVNDIIDAVFPLIATNYTNDELVAMAPQLLTYDIVDTTGFPFDKANATVKGKGSCVVPVNLEENVKQLHEYLFGNADYQPSNEVTEISSKINSETGY
ncbi:LCP family protein [Clostridiaceae bacterium Marseille-Q4145]|nr:LCP family protein [Clostridiaceae bacterium Marseille-Q4145]